MGVPDNYDTLQRRRAEYRRTAPWAAVKVQASVRRLQAKARVARLKREQLEQRAAELKAAVVIQAHERGHAERQRQKREAELALRIPAATVIQSHWRRWQKRSVLADIRDKSFRRRRAVLDNDLEEERRRRAEVDARVAALEEDAWLDKVAAAESHRRAQLNKVKREDERKAKALARETQRQREALWDKAARGTVDKRNTRRAEQAVLEEYATRALAAKDLMKQEALQKKLQASLVTNVERELAVQHAQEEYSVASQRREDREALASLCKELGGRTDALTGAGVGELFRALDPEGYRPEKLPTILAEMGAKTIVPLPGSVPRQRFGMTTVQAAVHVLAQQSNAHVGVALDRLVKWFDRRGSREIAELLGIATHDRLSAPAVLGYVLRLRADEQVLYATRYCQRVWRGKHARLATVPQIQQRRAQLQEQLQVQRDKAARDQLQRREKAALVLETYVRAFLARRKVQRVRQRAIHLQMLAQQKAESRRQSQLRLTGRSDYHTHLDATGARAVPYKTAGVDVFTVHEAGQVVESVWPKNWLRCVDEHTGRAYWYNHRTCESRWDAPPELAGLRPAMKHATSAHEDGSWTERQNYKARTASVTAGVYSTRQPRHERARIIRRSGKAARPQSLPSARRAVGSQGAPGQGSDAATIKRRLREETSTSLNHPQSQRLPERPASARPTSTARPKRPHCVFQARPASTGRFNRPQSAAYPTSDQSAGDLHAAMRRAHLNQLSQPKAIAAALRLQSAPVGAQFEAHPPPIHSSSAFKAHEPIIPTAALFSQHRSSESRRRPQSARAAVHVPPPPVGAAQHRPKSATAGGALTARYAGQGPLGRSFQAH